MITEKERDLVNEIFDEGCRKYTEKLSVLADVLGCDASLELDRCSYIGRWLVENESKYRCEFKRRGLTVTDTDDDGTTFTMHGNDGSGGDSPVVFHVNWYKSGSTLHAVHYMRPSDARTRHDHTAEDAIDSVAKALWSITMWTLLAARYRAIKADVDDIETRKSDARVEKAMHQLELLKKL